MSQSAFNAPIRGHNALAGLHASGHGTINNYFATPPQFAQDHEAEIIQREMEACLQSLTFPTMNARHDDISDAHPHTCDWLFSTPEFQEWQDRADLTAHNGVLWIKGKPGAGKSTLMKHTLNYCKDNFQKHLIVAYFFNARGDLLEKTPQGLWQSLLYQLLNNDNVLREAFFPTLEDMQRIFKGNNFEWKQPQLRSLVASTIKQCSSKPVLLLVDALDECNERDVRDVVDFLESLSMTSIQLGVSLRICLSSRHYPSISMKKNLELIVEKSDEHQQDIALYIKEKLRIKDDDIESQIENKAHGTFMWVVLVVALLNKAYDEGQDDALQIALEDIPEGLEELFENILSNNSHNKDEMVHMFQWVLLSERPLSPLELFVMVTRKVPSANDIIERRITTSSNGLIEIRKGGEIEIVQFIHLSVSDFLFRNNRLQTLDQGLGPDPVCSSHNRLWADCLFWFKRLGQKLKDEPQSSAYLDSRRPGLTYSLTGVFYHSDNVLSRQKRENWFDSLKAKLYLRRNSRKQDDIKQWIQKYQEWFQWWSTCYTTFEFTGLDDNLEGNMGQEPLYLCSLLGCTNLVSTLLASNLIHIDLQGHKYGNALQAALHNEHEQIAKMLIEKGIDVNAQGGHYGNALQAASWHGLVDIAKMILSRGADANIQGGRYGNALQAASTGSEHIVEMLLEMGADVNAQGGHHGNALQAACSNGNEAIIKRLLREGANINAQPGEYGTALQTACMNANEDIIKLLLQEGANIDAKCSHYGNALQAASWFGRKDVVNLLLQKGADVNAQGGYHGNALKAACSVGNEDIVKLLLQEGADVNAQGGHYGNALQAASWHGRKNIVKLLLQKGADVNAQGGEYGDALQAASDAGHENIVKLLQEEISNSSTT